MLTTVFRFTILVILCRYSTSVRNSRGLHNIATYSPDDNLYPCICPGILRPVCIVGVSGNIIQYPNLCIARCESIRNKQRSYISQAFTVHKRSLCKEHSTATMNETNIQDWIQEIDAESKFYTKVNTLMQDLLDLSSAGAPDCVCPPINRPICYFEPTGAIAVKYLNICTLKCDYIQNPKKTIAVNPSLCNKMENSTTSSFEPDAIPTTSKPMVSRISEEDTEQWIESMEKEIKFYKQFNGVMDGLF